MAALVIAFFLSFYSGGRKSAGGASSAKASPAAAPKPSPKQSPSVTAKTLKVSDEITIIPQGKNTQMKPKTPVLVRSFPLSWM